MTTLATRTSSTQRPTDLESESRPEAASAEPMAPPATASHGSAALLASERSLSSWALLFGSLCLSAGHGFVLVIALGRLYGLPNLRELGGPRTATVIAWFVACLGLAPLALALRRRLTRSRLLGPLAIAAAVVTALAFAAYAYKVARG